MDVTVSRFDDDSTPDAGPEPDLTPRTLDDPGPPRRRRRHNRGAYLLLLLIVAAIGYVIFQGLSSAALYYRNADEAVAQKQSLGTKRFRVQGTVENLAPTSSNSEVDFDIAFNGVTVPVHHTGGDPPELFKVGIPVVLEGHWDKSGAFFASDTILVKHSADYKQQNPDRVPANAP
jgi:cytochrome c-type biogenesis protein CcmE